MIIELARYLSSAGAELMASEHGLKQHLIVTGPDKQKVAVILSRCSCYAASSRARDDKGAAASGIRELYCTSRLM